MRNYWLAGLDKFCFFELGFSPYQTFFFLNSSTRVRHVIVLEESLGGACECVRPSFGLIVVVSRKLTYVLLINCVHRLDRMLGRKLSK
jgi:hypothetical protein